MKQQFVTTLFTASLALLAQTARALEDAGECAKFESSVAKKAVSDFRDSLEELDKKMDEQVDLAREKLKKDLEAALKAAVEKKDFAEVQRISSFLEAGTTPVQVNSRATELESQLERSKHLLSRSQNRKDAFRPELLVGSWSLQWNHKIPPHKEFLVFSPDGKITTYDGEGRSRTNGEWNYDAPRQRVLIRWITSGNWDSLHFPFHNNTTTGDSHAGPNVIRASKVE